MPRPESLGVPCDICGKDEYWNNTQSKKNAKAPDWVCANKECPGKDGFKFGRWERDRAKWGKGAAKVPVKEPQGGRITGDDTTPDERGERVFTYEALAFTYRTLFGSVVKTFKANEVTLDPVAIQAAVATMLITGKDQHIPLLHPRPKPKPEPKQVAKESYAERPAGLDEEDFEDAPLPF